MPLIDVVIPTYNRWEFLRETVADLAACEQVCKIIVVNDSSVDAGVLLDERVTLLSTDRRRGAASARNVGARACDQDFVLFTDDDIEFGGQGVQGLIDALIVTGADIAAPGFTEAVSSRAARRGTSGPWDLCSRLTLERRSTRRLLAVVGDEPFECYQMCGVMLMRRTVLAKIAYAEDLGHTSYRDETDFQLRALTAGFRMVAVPSVWISDRHGRAPKRGGCHDVGSRLAYEVAAIRNNWKVLGRHRELLYSRLGVTIPLSVAQGAFILSRVHSYLRWLAWSLARPLRPRLC